MHQILPAVSKPLQYYYKSGTFLYRLTTNIYGITMQNFPTKNIKYLFQTVLVFTMVFNGLINGYYHTSKAEDLCVTESCIETSNFLFKVSKYN